MKLPKRSEGELFLESFLRDEKIKFLPETKINHLRDDDKGYRVADFYLPKYKVFIEFQGLWNNSKDDRERYKEKMRVYHHNDIPCLYLYPENLGVIDYVFHVRMLDILKKFKMRQELLKYKFFRFARKKHNLLVWFTILLYSTIMGADDMEHVAEGSIEESVYMIIFLVVIVQFIMLINAFINYFVKER